MTSTRPYLLRAMYEWILDNGMTPHVLVNSQYDQVIVPRQYEQDGKIVLNISPTATEQLVITNTDLTFHARFEGSAMRVVLPVHSILAIYTRENGRGMMFEEDGDGGDGTTPPESSSPDGGLGDNNGNERKPHLKIVK